MITVEARTAIICVSWALFRGFSFGTAIVVCIDDCGAGAVDVEELILVEVVVGVELEGGGKRI